MINLIILCLNLLALILDFRLFIIITLPLILYKLFDDFVKND